MVQPGMHNVLCGTIRVPGPIASRDPHSEPNLVMNNEKDTLKLRLRVLLSVQCLRCRIAHVDLEVCMRNLSSRESSEEW
eukprot:1184338-Amphidinium_carterae.1